MSRDIGVIVIHGMGSQRPGFSAGLIEAVSKRLGDKETRLQWQEVHWANTLKSQESRLWEHMLGATDSEGSPIPLDWRSVREFVVHNFGDALAYHRDPRPASAYHRIHQVVSAGVSALKASLADPDDPVVVIAHSLGGFIMSNYIWDRQRGDADDEFEPIPNLTSMITFGCNIPLFSLSFGDPTPIDVPGRGVTDRRLIEEARWLNFLDCDDVLGWPIKPLYEQSPADLTNEQRRTVDKIVDEEINVGGISTAWNPAAHGRYWQDRDFVGPVAHHLLTLLRAMDEEEG